MPSRIYKIDHLARKVLFPFSFHLHSSLAPFLGTRLYRFGPHSLATRHLVRQLVFFLFRSPSFPSKQRKRRGCACVCVLDTSVYSSRGVSFATLSCPPTLLSLLFLLECAFAFALFTFAPSSDSLLECAVAYAYAFFTLPSYLHLLHLSWVLMSCCYGACVCFCLFVPASFLRLLFPIVRVVFVRSFFFIYITPGSHTLQCPSLPSLHTPRFAAPTLSHLH